MLCICFDCGYCLSSSAVSKYGEAELSHQTPGLAFHKAQRLQDIKNIIFDMALLFKTKMYEALLYSTRLCLLYSAEMYRYSAEMYCAAVLFFAILYSAVL